VRWRQGVTNIILWIYVYDYFFLLVCTFSSSSCRYAVPRFVFFQFAVRPTVPPILSAFCLSHLCQRCFYAFIFYCHDPPMPILSHSFEQYFSRSLFSLLSSSHSSSVMFSGSCYVANLTHRLLIGNRDDYGGGLFLHFGVSAWSEECGVKLRW